MRTFALQASLHLALPLLTRGVDHPRYDDRPVPAQHAHVLNAGTAWPMDWQVDAADVRRSPDNALVIVHRQAAPVTGAHFHGPIIAVGGTRLDPIAGPDTVHGWLHATHTGRLQGIPVVVDHFLIPDGHAPGTLVRVVRPAPGSAPVRPFTDLAFLRELVPETGPDPLPTPRPRIVTEMDNIRPERL